ERSSSLPLWCCPSHGAEPVGSNGASATGIQSLIAQSVERLAVNQCPSRFESWSGSFATDNRPCPESAGGGAKCMTVTVSVPFFGKQEYLRRCVKSLLAQTHKDVHVLVIADGMPVGRGLPADSRLQVYRLPENKGAYYAR